MNQIQPGCVQNDQADAGRDGQTRLTRYIKFLVTNGGRAKMFSLFHLTTSSLSGLSILVLLVKC